MIPMTEESLPSAVRLRNLEDMRTKEVKQGGISRVTVSEGLVPHIEPPFSWLTDYKITHYDADSVRIRRPMWGDETQSFAYAPQGKLRLEVDGNNH